MNCNIEEMNKYFLKRIFDIKNKYKNKKVRKKKLLNDFDKLFFNLLNLINYDIPLDYDKNLEKKIKYEISHKLENFKYRLKNNVIENICYEDNINLYSLSCLCSFYKLNIIYSNDYYYYKMIFNDESEIFYIVNNNKEFFNIKNEKLETFYDGKYEIVDINKPIYSQTHYKVDELKEICNQLKLPISDDKKYKKLDYYQLIKSYFENNII